MTINTTSPFEDENDTNNQNPEIDNDDFIFEMMISQGRTQEEVSEILHNFYHYGSPDSPDETDRLCAQHSEPYEHSEEFVRFLAGLNEIMATKSSEQSAI